MIRYILLRFASATLVVLCMIGVVFILIHLSGDPVAMMLPLGATSAEIDAVRHQMGLDKPLWLQLGIFFKDMVRGKFGTSYVHKQPAMEIVLERVPASLSLAILAIVAAICIAIPVGLLTAVHPNTYIDYFSSFMIIGGQSLPTFYVGILLVLFFGVKLRWFPTQGYGSVSHFILPAITLSTFTIATIMRIVRSHMLEVLGSDYIRTAWAKGIPQFKVILKHGSRNAAIPIVTIIGIQMGMVVTAAFVTETVFAWPGLGRLTVEAVLNRDTPVVIASVILSSFAFVFLNMLIDITYVFLNPEVRLS